MQVDSLYSSDIERIREREFPFLKGATYVDHAGAALYSRSQIEAYQNDLLSNLYGNPHSNNQSSRLATDVVDQIRYRILRYFNTNNDEYNVIFTSGCTGALKLIAETFTFDPCLHGNGSYISKESQTSTRQTGVFCYILDNHTSVQGMRESIATRVGMIICLDPKTIEGQGHKKEKPVFAASEFVPGGNNLFVYPAQSNFSGHKYPLEWTGMVECRQMGFQGDHLCQWYTVLDAAAFVSTSCLDLQKHCPDFITLSFYKMFGFPTGLGALLVKNSSAHVLRKTYFGGGTVAASSAQERFHVFRESVADRFEDGTIPFLEIMSLQHGFDALENIAGGIIKISQHTFTVARFFYQNLVNLHHGNGQPLAEVYCHGDFDDITTQGPIICFNLHRADGSYVGFSEVDKMAQLHDVHLRTGCFCNIGACQMFLNLSSTQIKDNFNAGHVCGDDRDLINGLPTGAVRISFGYTSTLCDAQICLQFISQCFLEGVKPMTDFLKLSLKDVNNLLFSNNCDTSKSGINTVKLKHAFKSENTLPDIDLNKDRVTCLKTKGKEDISQTDSLQEKYKKSTEINIKCCNAIEKSNVQSIPTSKSSMSQSNALSYSKRVSINSQSDVMFNPKEVANSQLDDWLLSKGQRDNQSGLLTLSELEITHILGSCSENERRLTGIYVYPVKSCAAFQVDEWPVHSRGLLYDRDWMIVSETGVVLSQKRETKLCLIRPRIDLQQQTLELSFPDMPVLVVPLSSCHGNGAMATKMCTSKVCGDRVSSTDCGDEAAHWLSQALQRPGSRLVQQNKTDPRQSKLRDSPAGGETSVHFSSLSLVNESQYLLVTRQSVEDLTRRITQRQSCTADTNLPTVPDTENMIGRFRANLVIGGGVPFEEDNWNQVVIGDITFVSQGGCTRCQMVCVDQSTGTRSMEPLRTLAAWRGRKVPFGIHLRHADIGQGVKLRVGDPVKVITSEH